MNAKQISRIMYTAAILLITASANYLFNGSVWLLNALLITATLIAGYPSIN